MNSKSISTQLYCYRKYVNSLTFGPKTMDKLLAKVEEGIYRTTPDSKSHKVYLAKRNLLLTEFPSTLYDTYYISDYICRL